MISVIPSDSAVSAEQCCAVSSDFSGLILADCGDVMQQGPSKSMTYYYRRDPIAVFPALELYLNIQYLVICEEGALWMWCRPQSSQADTGFFFNPGQFIYEQAHFTV